MVAQMRGEQDEPELFVLTPDVCLILKKIDAVGTRWLRSHGSAPIRR